MLAEIVWNEGTVAIAAPFAVAIAGIGGVFWYKLGKARSDNALKRDMVARGMSAEEIERVMKASGSGDD